jgi:hypothetical protein
MELEKDARRSFSNEQLIPLLEIANTKNYDTVKIMVNILPKEATVEDMIALLEENEVNSLRLADILKEKEEKKQREEEQ